MRERGCNDEQTIRRNCYWRESGDRARHGLAACTRFLSGGAGSKEQGRIRGHGCRRAGGGRRAAGVRARFARTQRGRGCGQERRRSFRQNRCLAQHCGGSAANRPVYDDRRTVGRWRSSETPRCSPFDGDGVGCTAGFEWICRADLGQRCLRSKAGLCSCGCDQRSDYCAR